MTVLLYCIFLSRFSGSVVLEHWYFTKRFLTVVILVQTICWCLPSLIFYESPVKLSKLTCFDCMYSSILEISKNCGSISSLRKLLFIWDSSMSPTIVIRPRLGMHGSGYFVLGRVCLLMPYRAHALCILDYINLVSLNTVLQIDTLARISSFGTKFRSWFMTGQAFWSTYISQQSP